jgi:hypothetical protein
MLLYACLRIDTALGAAACVRLEHLLQLLHLKLLLCLQRCLATTQAPVCSKMALKRLLVSKRCCLCLLCCLALALLLDPLLLALAAGFLASPGGRPCAATARSIETCQLAGRL